MRMGMGFFFTRSTASFIQPLLSDLFTSESFIIVSFELEELLKVRLAEELALE